MRKITILGGGIAGLAAAAMLTQQNIDFVLYEKQQPSPYSGMGFILPDNGIEALKQFGLTYDIERIAVQLDSFLHFNEKGKLVFEKELYNNYALLRQNLKDALLQYIDSSKCQYNKEFSHFSPVTSDSKGFTTAHFTDGSTVESDIWLGVDGINSQVRKHLFPNHQLCSVPEKEIVGKCQSPALVKELKNRFVKFHLPQGGLAVGLVPCSPNEVVWFVQYSPLHFPQIHRTTDLVQLIQQYFPAQNPFLHQLIKYGNFEKTHFWNVCTMPPLPQYYLHNALLIGDAAHPLLTFTSQGVSMALEDVLCFMHYLPQYQQYQSSLDEIFIEYQQERYPPALQHHNKGFELLNNFLSPTALHSLPISVK